MRIPEPLGGTLKGIRRLEIDSGSSEKYERTP
jgi:hypothetical protein